MKGIIKRGFFNDLWFSFATPLEDQFWCFACKLHIHRRDRREHEANGHQVQFHDEQYYRYEEEETEKRWARERKEVAQAEVPGLKEAQAVEAKLSDELKEARP